VFSRELGVQPFPVTFHFYPDRAAFEAGLVEAGQDAASARETAAAMVGVGMHGRVLLNHDGLDAIPWPERVRMLAHELVHSLQYELADGSRGTSEQWLREGFAEWVAFMTVERLGGYPLADLRHHQLALFRASDRSRAPRLDDMLTFAQWVPLAGRHEIAPYPQAFLAADLLVERHGAPAIIGYFRQFASTHDYELAFRRAFREDRAAFEAALDERLGIRRRIPNPSSLIPKRTSARFGGPSPCNSACTRLGRSATIDLLPPGRFHDDRLHVDVSAVRPRRAAARRPVPLRSGPPGGATAGGRRSPAAAAAA
jgi:hypothetical protein